MMRSLKLQLITSVVLFLGAALVLALHWPAGAAQQPLMLPSFALLLLCGAAMAGIAWRCVKRIRQISDCLGHAADGDVNPRLLHIRKKDEVAQAALNLNRLLDVLEAFLKESEASMAAASHRQYYRKIIKTGMPGIFGKAADEISLVMDTMKERDEAFEKGLTGMTDKFDVNISSFLAQLQQSSDVLSEISGKLTSLAGESLDQSGELASASEMSSHSVNTVASTTEELSASIAEINRQLSVANDVTEKAVIKSSEAGDTIRHLEQSAQKIGDIVSFIETIAGQTNLLALNATIEAARAGEAGRGFAVVASEVKTLAGKTSDATSEIIEYISSLTSAISSTVTVIQEIGDIIGIISDSSGSIASSMDEQSAALNEILSTMHRASQSVDTTNRAAAQVGDNARASKNMAETLSEASSELSARSKEVAGELEVFLSNLKTQ